MGEEKSIIWAGFDVGKTSFVAALDEATARECRKVTSLPCREFKRNQDEVKKFFRWAKEEFPEAEVRIVMETTGCYSEHLAGWINQLRPDVPVTIENAGSIHAFIQSLNLPHKTDRLDAQAIARFGTERQPKPTNRPSKTGQSLFIRDRSIKIFRKNSQSRLTFDTPSFVLQTFSTISWVNTKNTGIRIVPTTTDSVMPPKTVVPRLRRLTAHAPVAMTSGYVPRTNVTAVISTERKRSLAAYSAAS